MPVSDHDDTQHASSLLCDFTENRLMSNKVRQGIHLGVENEQVPQYIPRMVSQMIQEMMG